MSYGPATRGYSKSVAGALPNLPGMFGQGLVALWPFYEGSGAVLRDISQNQVHGNLTSMDPPKDWSGSNFGYCLDFDGTNDYVDLPNPGGKKLQLSAITIFTIVRLNATQTVREFITMAGTPTVSGFGFGIDDTTSNKIKWYTATSGGAAHNLVSSAALNNFEWYSVAVTYFPTSAGTNKYIYINGHYDNSAATTVTLGYDATCIGGICTYRAAGSQFLNGKMAFMGVWNYAMTEQMVKNLHTNLFTTMGRTRTIFNTPEVGSYSDSVPFFRGTPRIGVVDY